MKKNIAGFSIVMAMGIVLLITLLAFMILEYIIPFGRNVKGIENASKAYYQATSGIEQALYALAKNDTGYSTDVTNSNVIGYEYTLTGNGLMLPPVGEGNSEYDSDWNIIAPGQPIQLEIGGQAIRWDLSTFEFRVPNLGSSEDLQGGADAIVNWQLSSETDSLSADRSWIDADEINTFGELSYTEISMNGRDGERLELGPMNFNVFHANECSIAGQQCTLKFSIVNNLLLEPVDGFSQGVPIPYLEWRFTFNTPVPLRYAGLTSEGKSYGFKKELEIKVPQQTIVEAFDFTVFQ